MWSWNFRDLWGLTGYLRDDLEQAEASAQAKWAAQHGADGGHASVTADSVRTGRLGTSVYTYTVSTTSNTSSTTPGITLALPSRTSAVVLKKPLGAGVSFFGIHAFDVPDAEPGDLLSVVLQSPGIYLISSAFNQVPGGGFSPYFPIGNRIALAPSLVTNTSTDTVTYFDMIDNVYHAGCLLMRVSAYDYESSPLGEQRYPAWVQIG